MGHTERNAAVDLNSDPAQASPLSLPGNVREYNFYQLVELLQNWLISIPNRKSGSAIAAWCSVLTRALDFRPVM